MVDAPRVSVGDLQKRMNAGEDFVFLDTRNPQAWAEADVKLPGAIRAPLEKADQIAATLPRNRPIVTYCT